MADYYPRTEGSKVTFYYNFMNAFSDQAVALGLLPADITAIGAAVSAYQTAGNEKGDTSAQTCGTPRPDLEARSVLNAEVELGFAKNGYTGVEIECRRGAEVDFKFLARNTEAPYLDNRASLLSAAPETRHYRARYLQKDLCVGEFS